MQKGNSRRSFLKLTGQSLIAVPMASAFVGCSNSYRVTTRPSEQAVINGVQSNVRDFGAVGDGTTKNTFAIQQTIDRCRILERGAVLLPSGAYLIGSSRRGIEEYSLLPTTEDVHLSNCTFADSILTCIARSD